MFASWLLQRGRTIPLSDMDGLPGDFITTMLRLCRWSFPGLVVALLLGFADFSHTVADSGLNFAVAQQVRPMEPVFVISDDTRNTKRPYQTSGDPRLSRTQANQVVNGRTALDIGHLNDTEWDLLRRQSALVGNYMSAASMISRRDKSPFISQFDSHWRVVIPSGKPI